MAKIGIELQTRLPFLIEKVIREMPETNCNASATKMILMKQVIKMDAQNAAHQLL